MKGWQDGQDASPPAERHLDPWISNRLSSALYVELNSMKAQFQNVAIYYLSGLGPVKTFWFPEISQKCQNIFYL